MEDMKSKIFKGASSVKEKFESSQELNELKLEVRELEKKRTNYILELGEAAYANFRRGEEIELLFGDRIRELDKRMFGLLNIIEQKRRLEAGQVCECGNALTPEDKFCKECGKKVEVFSQLDPNEMIECSTCKTLNPETNKYCNSCGYRLI